MYCISRIDSTLARITRAARGMIGIEMAMITLWSDGPERGRHHERQHEQRQPLQDVQDPLGDQIGLAADVAGQQPDDAAEHRAQERRGDAHDQRDARAVDDPRVDVAAEMVGAEPVLRARRPACRPRRWRSDRGSASSSAKIAVSAITSMSTPPAAPSGFLRAKRATCGHDAPAPVAARQLGAAAGTAIAGMAGLSLP